MSDQNFSITSENGVQRIRWNGEDITNGLKGLSISVNHHDYEPRIELELPVHAVSFEGDLKIYIPVDTAKLLMQAGWTPPPREQDDDVSTDDLHEREVR